VFRREIKSKKYGCSARNLVVFRRETKSKKYGCSARNLVVFRRETKSKKYGCSARNIQHVYFYIQCCQKYGAIYQIY